MTSKYGLDEQMRHANPGGISEGPEALAIQRQPVHPFNQHSLISIARMELYSHPLSCFLVFSFNLTPFACPLPRGSLVSVAAVCRKQQ